MGRRRFVMWPDNQQVQSVFQVNLMRLNLISGLCLCLWWWYTLVDCPEMAQTVLQLNIWTCVQDISQGMPPFALMFHQLVCVIAQGRH